MAKTIVPVIISFFKALGITILGRKTYRRSVRTGMSSGSSITGRSLRSKAKNRIEKTHVPLGMGRLDLDRVIVELARRYKGLAIIEGYLPWAETSEDEMEIVIQNRKFLEDRSWLK